MILQKPSVDDPFAAQAADIEAMLERTGYTPEEAAGRLDIRSETFRKYREGYQKAGRQILARIRGLQPSTQHKVDTNVLRDRPILSYIPRISWAHAGSLASYEELPSDWQDTVPNTSSDSSAFALTIKGECMSPDYARPGDDVIVTPNVQISNGCLVVAKLKDGSILFRKYILLKPDSSSFRLDCSNKDAGEDLKMTWRDVIWVYRVHAAMRNFD